MVDLRLEPMTEEQYQRYRASAEEGYARQIAEAGELTPVDAAERAAREFAKLLPEGLDTADNLFFQGYSGDTEVGMVWVALSTKSDGVRAWIYDIVVEEVHRRRGYGRAIMRALEDECRARQVTSIGLNVFGGNDGARALYEQEGYGVTQTQMRKYL
ncbi:GNAT family N-acetyltransferase [Actinoplanes sp. RD1]|uniref:GNAT family N-acetyltransferase n=1 Tax=Actinoplanes sp. RD1 TaxID=3064538 RepID=UPI0027408AF9|nr:GNAT family N-acetyltransferase [Actinoplanes sp. RD1]